MKDLYIMLVEGNWYIKGYNGSNYSTLILCNETEKGVFKNEETWNRIKQIL